MRELWGDGKTSMFDRALTEGSVILDESRARMCARVYEAWTCDQEVPEACWIYGGIFRGARQLGEKGRRWECARGTNRMQMGDAFACTETCVNTVGLECFGSSGNVLATGCAADEVCNGRCDPRRAIDDACSKASDCIAGLTCHANRCAPPLREGERCSARECAEGFACEVLTDHTQPRFCRKKLGPNAPCSFQGACLDGLACVGEVEVHSKNGPWPVAHGVCTPVPDLGERCDPKHDLDCADDAYCNPSRKCVTKDKPVGAWCGPGNWDCGSYAYCDADTARCRARLPVGTACTTRFGSPDRPYIEPCFESSCSNEGVCRPECG